jgi:putative addiction module component (TIGR02574 family)
VTAAASKILADALALSDEERRRLAELLLDSVMREGTESIDAAWAAEAARRADDAEQGEGAVLDGPTALADLKSKYERAAR